MSAKGKMSIRRATGSDIQAIMCIEGSSFGRDAWSREEFLDYLAEPETCIFLIAVSGGVLAGYAIGFRTQTRAEVDSIAVKPSHRDRGVAAALMTHLMNLLAGFPQ